MKEEFNFRDITSFEVACNHLGKPIPSFDGLSLKEINLLKLSRVIEVINNGWKPDFRDRNQNKWYPYFITDSDDVGTYDYTYYSLFIMALPLALYLESQEKAEYMGKTFTDLYNEL